MKVLYLELNTSPCPIVALWIWPAISEASGQHQLVRLNFIIALHETAAQLKFKSQVASKKRKLNNGSQIASKTQATKKEKAADRGFIPIPNLFEDDDNIELSDQDMAVLADFGQAAGFLKKLDHRGLMRYASLVVDLLLFSSPILPGTKSRLKSSMN